MTVSIRDASARPADLAWIEGQIGDYLEDLGRAHTGVFRVLPEFGHTDADQLRSWLSEPGSMLVTILKAGHPAGFARVLQRPAGSRHVDYRMVEFFIARPVRRQRLGYAAARLILDRFAGVWEIVEQADNPRAAAFWRHVVARYAPDAVHEYPPGGEAYRYFSSVR